MKNNKKVVIGTVILVAVILVGVGFASINDIKLAVSGNVLATPNQENFTVKFTEILDISDSDKVKAEITGDLKASISVKDLTAKGDYVEVAYSIKNTSPDLMASMAAEVTKNTNDEYFNVSCTLYETNVVAGQDTILDIKVELIQTPVENDETSDIEVTVTASPIEQGF